MRDIGIGLIGSGYIGKAHAIAYNAHRAVFGGPANIICHTLAEIDDIRAAQAAQAMGFQNSTSDWRSLLKNDSIDVISIATPNALHKEMAISALQAGKHVYVEKPLAQDTQEADEIINALEARPDGGKSTIHMLGYNYLCNPIIGTIRAMIEAGELGEIIHFRGRHNEDYMAGPDVPFSWRCEKAASTTGTLGDMGSHIISMAMYLVGPLVSVCSDTEIIIPIRRDSSGKARSVENEDQAHAILRFASGAMATLETSRVAMGKKQELAFEITGTKGSIEFNQERMNEFRLYEASAPAGRVGFKTVLVDTNCPDFGAFCPAPGHGLGYNDLKIIEVNRLLNAIEGEVEVPVDLYAGREIERVIDAWVASAERRCWLDIGCL